MVECAHRVRALAIANVDPALLIQTREVLNRVLANHTGQPIERIRKDTDRDRYLTAVEAKEYGLVDDVLTKPPMSPEDEEDTKK